MGSAPETHPPAPAIDRRWLWAARVTAGVSLAVFVAGAIHSPDALVILWPLLLGYGWLLVGLGRRPRRRALRLGAWLGLLMSVLLVSLTLAARGAGKEDWVVPGLLAVFALVQAALGVSALKLYRTAPAEAAAPLRRKWRFALGAGVALGVLLTTAAILPNFLPPSRRPANEAATVGTLRTLNTAAVSYAATYDNGYPASLQVLTLPAPGTPETCDRAGLIDDLLASGRKSGYQLQYVPGPPETKRGKGCSAPGVKSYQIQARSLEYNKTGRRSFYTDETAVIRGTSEDRAATAHDPPL